MMQKYIFLKAEIRKYYAGKSSNPPCSRL